VLAEPVGYTKLGEIEAADVEGAGLEAGAVVLEDPVGKTKLGVIEEAEEAFETVAVGAVVVVDGGAGALTMPDALG